MPPNNNFAIIHRTIQIIRPALWHLFGLSIFINLLVLTLPLYMLQLFERVVMTGHVDTLIWLTAMAVAATVIHAGLDGIRSLALGRIGALLTDRLKPDLIQAALGGQDRGIDVGTRPAEEAELIRAVVTGPAVMALFDLPWFPIFAMVIWIVHPVLGMIAVAGAAMLLALALMTDRFMTACFQQTQSKEANRTRLLSAAMTAAPSILALAMTPRLLGTWQADDAPQARRAGMADDVNSGMTALIRGLRVLIQIAILGGGIYLVTHQSLSAAAVIAVSILLGRALAPVDALVMGWRQLRRARDAIRHMAALLDRPPAPVPVPGDALPPLTGALRVDGLAYAPPGTRRLVLNQIGFSVPAGTCLAVVGPAGAGKSMLCDVVAGVRTAMAGTIRMDGLDLVRWPETIRARVIGYARMQPDLLPVSISANIARLASDTGPDPGTDPGTAVAEAARLAGIHDAVMALPDGYHTRIGSGGAPLSAALQQGVALARALYGRPSLLILDGLNPALGLAGERRQADALAVARKWGATVLIATTSETLVRTADQVLSLQAGRVTFLGTPADLEGHRERRA